MVGGGGGTYNVIGGGVMAPLVASSNINAVTYDGSTNYLGGHTFKISDSAYGIISIWFKRAGTGSEILVGETLNRLNLSFDASDILSLQLLGQGSASRFNAAIADSAITDTNWHHSIVSWDGNNLTTGSIECYIDGSQQTVGNGTGDGTIDLNLSGNGGVGAKGSGSTKFTGDMAQVYINFSESSYYDLTTAANLEKFYNTTTGDPRDLGSDGSTPTGTQPDHFFDTAAASYGTNAGSDTDWTANGTFADASTSPGPAT